jgi:hypothetical protein
MWSPSEVRRQRECVSLNVPDFNERTGAFGKDFAYFSVDEGPAWTGMPVPQVCYDIDYLTAQWSRLATSFRSPARLTRIRPGSCSGNGEQIPPAWREGGDSNPRRDLRSLTRLAGGRFQPLSHLPRPGPVYVVSGSQPPEMCLPVE